MEGGREGGSCDDMVAILGLRDGRFTLPTCAGGYVEGQSGRPRERSSVGAQRGSGGVLCGPRAREARVQASFPKAGRFREVSGAGPQVRECRVGMKDWLESSRSRYG